MNAVINQLSFAKGNYVTASAFSNHGKEFPEFAATSRLIEKKKAGVKQTETVVITAVDREEKQTRASITSKRELIISIPADYEPGSYELKTRDDVSFSLRESDQTIYEGISGTIDLVPAPEGNIKGKFNVDLELPDTDGETFILKGQFQVLKAR
ncbi:hypothetical protein LOY67_16815 [Pseudomonas sp. B21-056]|jgi:hypothetical protein|uniref:hypothetical protein n=1 Tax=Pseudomonas sp. B21-056 TaxID=2895495 RepID=UPI00223101F3|nr:hypothetical protein [Pseudomonas sp. B21-056]UZE21709.1 hypothetical protein LOY67_16815 [Pseudomonas sp. B21-056]